MSRSVTGEPIPTGERLIPHRPGLDGLRGLSVAAVLAYHAGFGWAVGGYLGVSVFFTLSGFLITSLILAEHDRKGRIDLRHFWGRRFRRLLPASLLALAGIGLFGLTVATAEQAERLAGDIAAAVGYVANWRFVLGDTSYGDLFAEPTPVLHFWSLAIEEQFYLLYPLFLVGVLAVTRGRRGPIGAVLAVAMAASIAASFVLGTGDIDRIYFGTDTRAAELLAGALLALATLALAPAVLKTSGTPTTGSAAAAPPSQGPSSQGPSPAGPRRRVAGLVPSSVGAVALLALGVAVVTVDGDSLWLYRGGFAAISVSSCMAIVGATRDGPLATALGVAPLRWLGLRSYGIYLYHWPVFLWLDAEATGLDPVPLFAVRLLVTFALSEVSYRLVEMPIRYRRPLPRRVLLLAPTGAAAVVAVGLVATATAPAPLVALDQSVDRIPPPPTVVPTADPDLDSEPDLVVVGDGLAGAVADELAGALGRRAGWRVEDLSDPACPLAEVGAGGCRSIVDGWVEAARGAAVVVVSFGPGSSPGSGSGGGVAGEEGSGAGAVDPAGALSALRRGLEPRSQVVWVTQPLVLAPGDPAALGIDPAGTSWPRLAAVNAAVVATGAEAGDEVIDLALYLSRSVEDAGTGVAILDHGDDRIVQGLGWMADQVAERVGARGGAPTDAVRILVVGDSVAYSLGRGLEQWATDTGAAVVWNVGTTGCGVVRGGVVPAHEIQPSPVCELWPDRFAGHLADFDPQVVVVVSTGWDLLERRLPGWPGFLRPGDALFDQHLRHEYGEAVEVLASTGASVAWATTPCTSPERAAAGSVFEPSRTAHQNGVIEQLAAADDRVALVDLGAVVCPGGEFTGQVDGVRDFRPDGVHFSDPGSRWVAERIGPALVEVARAD